MRNRGVFRLSRAAAEDIAIEALSYIAGEPAELGRFLALSGIEAGNLRAAAAEPGFLSGILDYVAGNEALVLAFAASAGRRPEDVAAARAVLSARGNDPDADRSA